MLSLTLSSVHNKPPYNHQVGSHSEIRNTNTILTRTVRNLVTFLVPAHLRHTPLTETGFHNRPIFY
ncbi:hypothetical protein Hanom_Chr02g00100261 [Helianthus anomalus]